MADKPIRFKKPMVRALLDDRKTQTRRIMKPQPVQMANGKWHVFNRHGGALNLTEERMSEVAVDYAKYRVGDRLWVRESFKIVPSSAYRTSEGVQQTVSPTDPDSAAIYAADWERAIPKWKPSIYMPRWASRLTLIVTDVCVERLQDIDPDDAIDEGILRGDPLPEVPFSQGAIWHSGIDETLDDPFTWSRNPVAAFRALWESINGPGSWEANPWVAAYTFDVHKCNVDAMPAQVKESENV